MSSHADSTKTYILVFAALIALTFITTGVAYIDLGVLSFPVAISIAVVKMLLVSLFFMHVRHSDRMTKMVLVGAFLWLFIMIAFSMGDYLTRTWMGVPGK